MKITGVVLMVTAMGAGLQAGQSKAVLGATVIVCMESDPYVLGGTRKLASQMFASIGVRIDWRDQRCPVGVGAIKVSLSYNTPRNQSPGALAFARPDERTIVVFTDRVNELQKSIGCLPHLLPAHVLVHEITHVLEGISRHSATGIMKAHWDRVDFAAMSGKPLPFAGEDIDLIYRGRQEWRVYLATAATAAVSQAAVASQ